MSARHLRVALLSINYSPESTGIAPYSTGIARALAVAGHEVRVFTSFPHYPAWRVSPLDRKVSRERHGTLSVRRLRHYVPSNPNNFRRAAYEASFGLRLVASRWHQPDVVICVSPALISSALAIARCARRQRPAVGLVVQDLYSRGIEETGSGGMFAAGLMSRLERRSARAVDGVVVIHQRFRNHLVNVLGVNEDRVTVIRNWTHVHQASSFDVVEFRRSMGWLPNETVVLHAGAMGLKQDLDNVVAAARLAEARGERVRFVLMGDGSQRTRLETLGLGVRTLQFCDPLDDERFSRALHAADALLVNERQGVSEMAVPSKLTSYFNSGRAVLAATDEGSVTAEELRSSGGGLRVNPGQPAELLEVAIQLRSNPDLTGLLAKRGLEYCRTTLSEAAALSAYNDWVVQLAARA